MIPAFLAGVLLGVVVGTFVVGGFVAGMGLHIAVVAGATGAGAFVAGLVLGMTTRPKQEPIRLTGRIFEFPQGPIMVEVALKRASSLIPARVTRE
ncbi:MAG: hypothetical protein DRJ18_02740 [Candidatus Methanomethylicota archaeon]|nr:MAG: hypothetical protein DRJ18_02740 [Candidatus Verstraetearchaeota archaeon]